MADPVEEKAPRWLHWLGVVVLVVVLLFAVFSLGVFVGERGLTRGVVPPWPAPVVTPLPTPSLPPIPTIAPPTTELHHGGHGEHGDNEWGSGTNAGLIPIIFLLVSLRVLRGAIMSTESR